MVAPSPLTTRPDIVILLPLLRSAAAPCCRCCTLLPQVSDSLCRKGSAAIRLRSGVLRRTGFLEGHTETLKPQTSITSFRQ